MALAWLSGLPLLGLLLLLLWPVSPASDPSVAAPFAGTPGTSAPILATPASSTALATRVFLAALILSWWSGTLYFLRERLVRPLQTLSNLLSGLREGDYSFRARGARRDDPLGDVFWEVNALVETMRQQRLGALEATHLLRAVMAEIEVAVFAFDADQRLRLVNRAGARLLAQPEERLLSRYAAELGLAECLAGEPARTLQATFPGAAGRWRVQRQLFRQSGLPHQLLVLSDLSRELREEERLAWQRLVRVLGHELNNSLAPVRSLAGSLETLLQREPLPADWRDDMRDGLSVIASRAEALSRFVGAYAQLARLPQPRFQPVALGPLLQRVVSLETRHPVHLEAGPDLTFAADPDQLEQALINLVRNAVDAVLETPAPTPVSSAPPSTTAPPLPTESTPPRVQVCWLGFPQQVEIRIEDQGPGLANTANLFVPFFTTKQKGSGIGLVLCRQIAEGHGGSLTLENRPNGPGCLARLQLPRRPLRV